MPTPVRARARAHVIVRATLVCATLVCAALGLSACDTVATDWLGSGDETAAEPTSAPTSAPTSESAAESAASAQGSAAAGNGEGSGEGSGETSGETGQVVEIISSDAAPTGQSAASGASQGAAELPAESPAESLAALPPEPAFNDDPQQLIGMGPASLNAFLGAPELIRRETPASLWQYRAEDCVLDVVLYPDRSGDKVTYLEARENGATKMSPRTCLNKLLRARYDDTAG